MIQSGADIDGLSLQVARKLGWTDVRYSASGFLVGGVPGKKIIRAVPRYVSDLSDIWNDVTQTVSRTGMDVHLTQHHLGGGSYSTVAEIVFPGELPWRAVHRKASVALCYAFLAVPEKYLK